jgi:putative hydrolase of the HAD superfamily
MPPIALLLDFDGVLRRWEADDAAIESRYGLPVGSIRRTAFSPEFLLPAITGQISDGMWRDRVADELQQQHSSSSATEAVAEWSAPVGQVDSEVLGVLARCRSELRLILSTNATSRLAEDLRSLGLADRFHAVANSSEIGAVKPSAAYFKGALVQANVRASEALFVDDSLANVEAAAALGIRSHHFTDHVAFSAFLNEAGALIGNAV